MISKEGWDYVSCTYLHIPNEADLEFNQVFLFHIYLHFVMDV